jgi:N-acetylated-alpha-linked acidic dipeptidase
VDAAEPNASAETKARAAEAQKSGLTPLGDLGSGSDYTPFVQHLGVASINLAYGGEGMSGGVYHSAYDSFEHYVRFGDPGLVYGVVLAQTAGRTVLRAANADLDPYQFGNLAVTVAAQVEELKKLLGARRDRAKGIDYLLDGKAYALAADPTQPSAPPDRLSVAPDLDFGPLDKAVDRLRASASAYDAAAAKPVTRAQAAKADVILQGVEQALTSDEGLPGRPWYKHLLYAPGLLTGYGSKTLPGVREAIEGGEWDTASQFIARTAQALDAATAKIDQATRALSE